jgi:Uncharacterised nucleotidyltransferase
LPPSSPFGTDFLRRDWPLLLASCSIPRDPATIKSLAREIRDPESLVCLAEAHGLVGHVAAALAELSDEPSCSLLLDSLRPQHRSDLLSNLALTAELFRILELLRQSSVETVVVKGPALSLRAYGDPSARQYADIDLLVRHADIPRAAEIFIAAGYESRVSFEAIRAGKIPGEYRFRRDGAKIIIELHTERTLRYFPLSLPVEEYFRQNIMLALDGNPIPALSPEHEFVLISIHGATHFWERLMWIADIAALVHNHASLDWNRVRRCASDVGAERMLRLALLLAKRLLGVPVPSALRADVQRDTTCTRLAGAIETWLPFAGYAPPSLTERAEFRFRMHGSFFNGLTYLARLSFSPTEDDWADEGQLRQSRVAEVLRRSLRLARKYRRTPE